MTKKKMTPIVVETPEVNNTINMTITHNDVIDVAIQSQLEILELQRDEIKKALEEAHKQLDSYWEKTFYKVKRRINSLPEFKALKNLVVKMGGKEDDIKMTDVCFGKREEEVRSESYLYCDFDHVEERKNSPLLYKKNTDKRIISRMLCKAQYFRLKAELSEFSITANRESSITLTEKEYACSKEELKSLLDNIAFLSNKYYEVRKDIIEIKHNDKKIKAKIIKTSLSKTEEGRTILELLQQATKFKILE